MAHACRDCLVDFCCIGSSEDFCGDGFVDFCGCCTDDFYGGYFNYFCCCDVENECVSDFLAATTFAETA